MPPRRVNPIERDAEFDLVKLYSEWMHECEVGEAYDYDIEPGETEEEVRAALSESARRVLGKRLRFVSREEPRLNGKPQRVVRMFVTNNPAAARTVMKNALLPTFQSQTYYDDLVRKAKVGTTYEIELVGTPRASAERRLDSAGRRLHGRKLDFAYREDDDGKVILRYTVTDRPATKLAPRSHRYQTVNRKKVTAAV